MTRRWGESLSVPATSPPHRVSPSPRLPLAASPPHRVVPSPWPRRRPARTQTAGAKRSPPIGVQASARNSRKKPFPTPSTTASCDEQKRSNSGANGVGAKMLRKKVFFSRTQIPCHSAGRKPRPLPSRNPHTHTDDRTYGNQPRPALSDPGRTPPRPGQPRPPHHRIQTTQPQPVLPPILKQPRRE